MTMKGADHHLKMMVHHMKKAIDTHVMNEKKEGERHAKKEIKMHAKLKMAKK